MANPDVNARAAAYGVQQTNPLDSVTEAMISNATGMVAWTDPKLARVVRLRLISDVGFPYWDVSYCYGQLKDGTVVRVQLPFSQLPKFNINGKIVEYAVRDHVFAKGLGIFNAISTLQ